MPSRFYPNVRLQDGSLVNTTASDEISDHSIRSSRATSSLDHLVMDDEETLLPHLSVPHYAGYIRLYASSGSEKKERNIFYWMFSPDIGSSSNRQDDYDKNINYPIVIWLNGGPGSSSMTGLFLENGPFKIVRNESMEGNWIIDINPHSWHLAPAWVVYVDQPVGTGFSFVKDGTDDDMCTSDDCINSDFYEFLRELLWLHRDTMLTEHSEPKSMNILNRELYIMGESYAGHYIPTIVNHILDQNKNLHTRHDVDKKVHSDDITPQILIPISGMAIGNGYMDARTQYSNSESLYAHGFIDMSQKAALDAVENRCIKLLENGLLKDSIDCFEYFDGINTKIAPKHGSYCSYDARIWLSHGQEYPVGRTELEAYLGGGDPETRIRIGDRGYNPAALLRAIHVTDRTDPFLLSAPDVGISLCTYTPHYLIPVKDEIVNILNSGMRVLFYNGLEDLMCDHIRNERLIEQLPWNWIGNWTVSERLAWITNVSQSNDEKQIDAISGFVKSFKNLSFLKILNAGHFVPMDQPEISLLMLRQFLSKDHRIFPGPAQTLIQQAEEKMNSCQENDAEISSTQESTAAREGFILALSAMFILLATYWIGRRSKSLVSPYAVVSVENAIC